MKKKSASATAASAKVSAKAPRSPSRTTKTETGENPIGALITSCMDKALAAVTESATTRVSAAAPEILAAASAEASRAGTRIAAWGKKHPVKAAAAAAALAAAASILQSVIHDRNRRQD